MPTKKPRLSVTVDESYKQIVDDVAASAHLDTSVFVRMCVDSVLDRLGPRRERVEILMAIAGSSLHGGSVQAPMVQEHAVQAQLTRSDTVPAPVVKERNVQAPTISSEIVQAPLVTAVGGRRKNVHIVKDQITSRTFCGQNPDLKEVSGERKLEDVTCALCLKFYKK